MSRNPYHTDGIEPTLRPSAFVFMDILGYTELMRRSVAKGTQQSELRSLHRSLTKGRQWLEGGDPPAFKAFAKKDFFALKAFTDNIVIGWPIRDDAEIEFGEAFFKLGAFQFQMILDGYFVRGALCVGEAYVDEIAVFGEALMDAYMGESKVARDPRIILTSSAVEKVKTHLTYYGNQRHAPHVRELLCDSDGQWFLNYLECVLWAEDERGPFYEELAQHRAMVETKLEEHRAEPQIWSKYAWVAGYHNYFCDLHPEHFNDEHKVRVDLFRAVPKQII